MNIKFRAWGKEAQDIKSGKLKSIRREIDRLDPVFHEIEDINSSMALAKTGSWEGSNSHTIRIQDKDGYDIFHGKISKINYEDGDVIIDWVDFDEHKNLNKPKTLKKHERS